jgi:hypothetical protein
MARAGQRGVIKTVSEEVKMIIKILIYLVSFVAAASAYSDEVYKWKDGEGRTHFSDSVPQSHKHRATPVELKHATVTPAEREAANVRVEKEKAKSAEYQSERTKASAVGKGLNRMPNKEIVQGKMDTCEEQWKKYDESHACFNPHRLANGAVRAEAFKHCATMDQPKCNMPPNNATRPNY